MSPIDIPTGPERAQALTDGVRRALAGGRAVALTGHVHDIVASPGGALMRPENLVALLAAEQGADAVTVDETSAEMLVPSGRAPLGPPVRLAGRNTADVLRQLRALLADREQPVWILIRRACLALDDELLRELVDLPLDVRLESRHRLVAVFATQEPPATLTTQPGWSVIDVPLPELAERGRIWRRTTERRPVELEPHLLDAEVPLLLGGLDGDAIRRLGAEAAAHPPLTRRRIVELKNAEIRRLAGDSLEVLTDPDDVPHLAGLPGLRLIVQRARAARTMPGVLLLAGPPGVGKTHAFRWLAHELGIPAVKFGQIRGRYVGDSERAIARARRVVEACAPVAVLRDEADMLDGDDRDGGVSSRLRAEMLDLLNVAPKRGIVVVLTTNDPLGGFDERIRDRCRVVPVLHLAPAEAGEVARIEAARRGLRLDADAVGAVVHLHGHGMTTGRAVEKLVAEAAWLAAEAAHPLEITAAEVRAAYQDVIDLVDADGHERMALEALLTADSRATWPWVAATRLDSPQEAQLPPYLAGLVGPEGDLDVDRMRERVRRLRGRHD